MARTPPGPQVPEVPAASPLIAPLTFQEAQARVDRWIGRFEEGYWPPLAILARLMEEVGELSREINHRFGSKPKRDDEAPSELELEIGDVLFVLVSLANQQGIDLGRAFERVMEKYEKRDRGRWTPKPKPKASEAAGGNVDSQPDGESDRETPPKSP